MTRLRLGLSYVMSGAWVGSSSVAGSVADSAASNLIHLGHNMVGGTLTFDGVESESVPGASIDTKISYASQISFGYEYFDAAVNNWGKAIGFSYQGNSKEKEIENTVNLNNTSTTTTSKPSDPDSISVFRLYYNWVYRFEQFYIPLGLNLTLLSFDSDNNNYDSGSGAGLNFGFGWILGERSQIEFVGYGSTAELTMTQEDGSETRFGSGIYAEWIARFKLGLF